MRIAIIGAGHLGYIIAEFLSNEQYDVVVVDLDESKLDAIRDALDVLTIMPTARARLLCVTKI